MIPVTEILAVANLITQAHTYASSAHYWARHSDWIQNEIVAEQYYSKAYSLGRQAFDLWDRYEKKLDLI